MVGKKNLKPALIALQAERMLAQYLKCPFYLRFYPGAGGLAGGFISGTYAVILKRDKHLISDYCI